MSAPTTFQTVCATATTYLVPAAATAGAAVASMKWGHSYLPLGKDLLQGTVFAAAVSIFANILERYILAETITKNKLANAVLSHALAGGLLFGASTLAVKFAVITTAVTAPAALTYMATALAVSLASRFLIGMVAGQLPSVRPYITAKA